MIKNDITAGLLKLGVEDRRGFAKLNKAIITFIRKKHDAAEIGGFHPISIVHGFSKLFLKVLTNHPRKRLGDIISVK
jgi:hypothetical protein